MSFYSIVDCLCAIISGTSVLHDSVWNCDALALFLACRLLETVDFQHTQSFNGAIVHSGDVIDRAQSKGEHSITVHLQRLPAGCGELWFTMSGWGGVTLAQIRLPCVRLSDAGNVRWDTRLIFFSFVLLGWRGCGGGWRGGVPRNGSYVC